jgi:DNA-binding phage protein
MAGRESGGSSGCVSWLALLLSLTALGLAWVAFQRTGGDLPALVHGGLAGRAPWEGTTDSLGDASSAVGHGADVAAARTRLLARRGEVAAERNLEQVEREVEGVRSRLARTFGNASSEAHAGWQELDGDLRHLEAQLREGGNGALATLDSVLRKLGARDDDSGSKADRADGKRRDGEPR